jgi:hypothetical protein
MKAVDGTKPSFFTGVIVNAMTLATLKKKKSKMALSMLVLSLASISRSKTPISLNHLAHQSVLCEPKYDNHRNRWRGYHDRNDH